MRFERTVLGGFSQGAVMTHALSLARGAERPAGSIALSGFVPTVPGYELDPATAPPYAIGHGTYDPIIGVEWGRRARDLLEAAGGDVTYREAPLPHAVDPGFARELAGWIRGSFRPSPCGRPSLALTMSATAPTTSAAREERAQRRPSRRGRASRARRRRSG